MASLITPETLEHLANLARIELSAAEKEKLLKDLQGILGHVGELQNVDLGSLGELESVKPFLMNVFRRDNERENTNQGAGKESFPEKKNGFLKVPPVFGE